MYVVYIGDLMTPTIEIWPTPDHDPNCIVIQTHKLDEDDAAAFSRREVTAVDLELKYPCIRVRPDVDFEGTG